MKIKYFCPIWGNENIPFPSFADKVKEAGYDGIEMNIPLNWKPSYVNKVLDQRELELIAQSYFPPLKETFNEYISRMENYHRHLADFNPLFINSHTGKDFFTFRENCTCIEKVKKISDELNVKIVHETHRGRFCYSPQVTLPYIESFPDITFTADLSHWVCVSESLLEGHKEALKQLMDKTYHIHARVGYSQGPQVPDPFIEKFKPELNQFTEWWKKLADSAKDAGRKELTISPEFGPEPYLPVHPKDGTPVSDQWELNVKIMEYLKDKLSYY